MIPYFSDFIFNTRRLASNILDKIPSKTGVLPVFLRRLAPKEATTSQDTSTLTQRKSSEYSLPSEISSILILVCFLQAAGLVDDHENDCEWKSGS